MSGGYNPGNAAITAQRIRPDTWRSDWLRPGHNSGCLAAPENRPDRPRLRGRSTLRRVQRTVERQAERTEIAGEPNEPVSVLYVDVADVGKSVADVHEGSCCRKKVTDGTAQTELPASVDLRLLTLAEPDFSSRFASRMTST